LEYAFSKCLYGKLHRSGLKPVKTEIRLNSIYKFSSYRSGNKIRPVIFNIPGYCRMSMGRLLQKFRNSALLPSSRVKISKTNRDNYTATKA